MKLVLATVIAMAATAIMLWVISKMEEPRRGSWFLQAVAYAITCTLSVASMIGLALCLVVGSEHVGYWIRSLL